MGGSKAAPKTSIKEKAPLTLPGRISSRARMVGLGATWSWAF
jgi:hypothetical protein